MLYPIAWRRNITSKIERFLDIKTHPQYFTINARYMLLRSCDRSFAYPRNKLKKSKPCGDDRMQGFLVLVF